MANKNVELVIDDKEVQRQLRLRIDKAPGILRRAMRLASQPIVMQMQANLRAGIKDQAASTGLTAEAMGASVKYYKWSQNYLSIMGPLRRFVGSRRGKRHVPANIAHLIESGHEPSGWYARQAGAKRVQGIAFKKRAMASRSGAASAILHAVIRAQLMG